MPREHSNPTSCVAAIAACLLVLLVAACGGRQPAGPRVFAAASLREAAMRAGADVLGVPVSISDGASGTLARQIADGAPADLFLSASPEWTEFLRKAGKLDGVPVLLARNELVIAVRADAPAAGGDLAAWLAAAGSLAVADEKAPAGRYARQALASLKAPAGLRLLGQDDVRGVLRAVQTGNAAAGMVYRSDVQAFADSVRVLYALDAALHDPIEIHGAVVAGARDAAGARRLLEFMAGPRGRAIFDELGFRAP